jgi:DNA-binding winged helix-turn-helix (wHTH) protein/tetratricopeptide (TPR) repeat protein
MSLENSPSFLLDFSEWDVNGENRHFYRFKSFRLDVEERRLLHHNLPVPLTPKAFDVLAVLVEHSGHLVEKDELLRTVWSDSFVEEANIARIIHTLRKTLAEDQNGNKFIETVAKKGYRFVAEVREVSGQPAANFHNGNRHSSFAGQDLSALNLAAETGKTEFKIPGTEIDDGASAPPVSAPKPKNRAIIFSVVLSGLVIPVLLLTFYLNPAIKQNEIRSIAVLPLKPINSLNRDELYEIGIADALIHRFGRTKSFIVRPLSATRKYMDIEQDPVAAGREQKVDVVLASNYQLVNGKIRVTSQLINVANGQIESTFQSSEIDTANIFTMQDAVANEVGGTLIDQQLVAANYKWGWGNFSIEVKPADQPRPELIGYEKTYQPLRKSNKEAYRLYWQGRTLTERRSPADAKKAVGYFEQSIRLDPNFAQAFSGLAYAYIMSGRLNGMPAKQVKKAREAVNKALELDNNLAEGYEVRGYLRLAFDWDFAGAEKDLRRAAELQPNSVLGLEFLAEYLASRERLDEAIAAIDTAIKFDPNSLALKHERGRLLYRARRYDEAILELTRLVEIDENFVGAYGTLQIAYEKKGDYVGAFNSFMNFVKRTAPEHIEIYQKIYEKAGWLAVQRKHIEFKKLRGNAANEGNSPTGNSGAWNYGLAVMNALIGEKEEAFVYLNKAIADRPAQMIKLNVEPAFDILRADPRFDELVRRVGLK